MGDVQNVKTAIACEVTNDESFISHGTARTIGSWFNDGADTYIYSFVSTGAIHEGDGEEVFRRMIRDLDTPTYVENGEALNELSHYLDNRVRKGDVGPVPGWSDMWVQG